MDQPRRLSPDDPALPQVLTLMRAAFAFMDGVIDPPSSIHALTQDSLSPPSEVWVMGAPPHAVMVLTPRGDALYLGKLAVAADRRGAGLARVMVDAACARARELQLPMVELQTRIELTGNQAAFVAMGFAEVARTAHPGYDRPTAITYRRSAA